MFFVTLTLMSLTRLSQAQSLYTFDSGVTPGTSTPFSLTNNGVTAQFSTTSGAFIIETQSGMQFASPFSGNYLFDTSTPPDANIPLIVNFSTMLNSVTVDFATDGPSIFQVAAFDGTTPVGTNGIAGSLPGGFIFPQGILSFSGANFNELEFSDSTAPAFAIDNLSVTTIPSAAPLPRDAALGLAAIFAVAALINRRWGMESSAV